MDRREKIRKLISLLLEEEPEYRQQAMRFSQDVESQRRLLRSLMNVRYPGKSLNPEYLCLQDELLAEEREEKGEVNVMELPPVNKDVRISVWQGDITQLRADTIVNAANSQMLGCSIPCHACIDNAIHSAAGLQLREECMQLMRKQGFEEPVGRAKITKGYNLPAKYVLHTVGPAVSGKATEEDIKKLESCYRSCLELAESRQIKSVVFCCISTGIFCFPNELAAGTAVRTVRETFRMVLASCTTGSVLIWAFCMFGNELLAGIFMAEPIADTLAVCTTSVCFYFSFHRLLKSMENGNVAEK